MTGELENLRQLTQRLRESLGKCASDPDVDAVHDTRTGTRRLQATLENVVRGLPEGDAADGLRAAATELMRQLKKIRKAAGPVRDLDVHRKLLQKLMGRGRKPGADGRNGKGRSEAPEDRDKPANQSGSAGTGEAGGRAADIETQANELDSWLKHRRNDRAAELQAHASGMLARMEKRMAQVEAALRAHRIRGGRKKRPGVVALDSFARLATEMQLLDSGNLHEFRKGAKKARYVAELAARGDRQAQVVGEALRKLQDEIGDWHDWLVLAEEAHAALGDEAPELTGLLERRREGHFVAAMKMAATLRGQLMGEWLAVKQPARNSTERPAKAAGGR